MPIKYTECPLCHCRLRGTRAAVLADMLELHEQGGVRLGNLDDKSLADYLATRQRRLDEQERKTQLERDFAEQEDGSMEVRAKYTAVWRV